MEISNRGNNTQFDNSYDNYNQEKQDCRSECGRNTLENNDNMSEKANSVQTSYKYNRRKKGQNSQNSISSKEYNYQDDDDISIEISENDNLICPNCINWTLMEDKKRREELDKERERELNRKYDYGNENPNALFDKNRNRERDMLDERRRQRE